jgi:hypothetical protein
VIRHGNLRSTGTGSGQLGNGDNRSRPATAGSADTKAHPGRRIFGDEPRNVCGFEPAVRRRRDQGEFAAQQPRGGDQRPNPGQGPFSTSTDLIERAAYGAGTIGAAFGPGSTFSQYVKPIGSYSWSKNILNKYWYPFITRRWTKDDVVFLNWGYEEDPPLGLALHPSDEPNRYCIQLYHRTATQADLSGKQVLEVSSGHGGGAAYLMRTVHPASYTRGWTSTQTASNLPRKGTT